MPAPTLPFYADFLSWLNPGAGSTIQSGADAGLTAEPGSGLVADNALTGQVPVSDQFGLADILIQLGLGGGNQGTMKERTDEASRRSFADLSLENVAKAFGFGLSMASGMGPLNLAAGEGINAILGQLHPEVAGVVDPALGVGTRLVGNFVPGIGLSPFTVPEFTGSGQFPPELQEALARAPMYSRAWYAARRAMQQYQEAYGGGASDPLGGAFSEPQVQERARDRFGQLNEQIGAGFFGGDGGQGPGGSHGVNDPTSAGPGGMLGHI